MKRNESFTLTNIAGVHYILPYGQMIADQRRGIRTNDTGAFLWNLLSDDRTQEELVQACKEHFVTESSDHDGLVQDIQDFTHSLSLFGMLEGASQVVPEKFYGVFSLGGLKVRFRGPSECFSKNFNPFRIRTKSALLSAPDLTVTVQTKPLDGCRNGVLLLRNPDLEIIETEDRYVFLFPSFPNIEEAFISKDATEACFSCTPPFNRMFRENLFHAIRNVFLYLAWTRRMLVIHSASILYRNRVWLFSGHSGMGKSTHANLWQNLYVVSAVNGDLNLFTMGEDGPVVKGIPWCGTSGICDFHEYPLGGIILLNQAPYDEVVELSEDEKRLLVSQRLISPTWRADMLHKNLEIIDEIAEKILICKLKCTKENSAAKTMKKYIDDYLDL